MASSKLWLTQTTIWLSQRTLWWAKESKLTALNILTKPIRIINLRQKFNTSATPAKARRWVYRRLRAGSMGQAYLGLLITVRAC